MARPLRFEYPGAVYHVMARGNGGQFIFEESEDCRLFLKWLEGVCGSHGWRVHAWVLMGNHFHLLLETPEPNLVGGMRVMLGAFAQAWNRRRGQRGHVFQGRYKSVSVSGERASDECQFRVVADYIHLNPARAGLAGGKKGKLLDYEWSSLRAYASRGKGPDWLVRERVLKGFELSQDGRGRRAYVDYLEKRARSNRGELSPEAMAALRRGWYLGDEGFRDRLLGMIDRTADTLKRKGSHEAAVVKSHGEQEAERIVGIGLKVFGLEPEGGDEQGTPLRKGDPRRVAIAMMLKNQTAVSNRWIAERLGMGHDRSVSRLIRQGKENRKIVRMCRELERMLPCED